MEFHKFSQILIVYNYDLKSRGKTERDRRRDRDGVAKKNNIAFAILSGFSIKIETKHRSGNVQTAIPPNGRLFDWISLNSISE